MIGSFVVAVLVFFSVIVVGWPAIMDYIKLLTSYLTKEHGHGSYPESMQNLRAVAQYLVSYSWARTLWLGLISLVLAAVLLLNASSGSNAESAAIQWIGNFVSGILIAPHFNAHDLTIVIVPVAFALKIFGDPVPAWLISSIVALGVYPLIALATGNILPPIVPVVLLAVLFFCVRRVRMVVNATDQPDKAMVST
jgi:hypothetical protein